MLKFLAKRRVNLIDACFTGGITAAVMHGKWLVAGALLLVSAPLSVWAEYKAWVLE